MIEENLAQVFKQWLEARLERVHTWLPAKIVTFDHVLLRATVRPTLLKVLGKDGKETKLPYPLVFVVPVDCLKTEHFLLRPPYAAGDPVTIGFYERSVERILRDIEQRDPYFTRRHHLKDAIVVQGRMTDGEGKTRPAPDCWIDQVILVNRTKPGSCFRMLPSGDVVVQVDASAKLYLGPGAEGCTPPEVAVDYALLGTRYWNWEKVHTHSCTHCGTTGVPTVPPPAPSEHVLIGE